VGQRCFVALGANLGDPVLTVRAAILALRELPRTEFVAATSSRVSRSRNAGMSLRSSFVTPWTADVGAPSRCGAISSTSSMNSSTRSNSLICANTSRSALDRPPASAASRDGKISTNGQPSRDAPLRADSIGTPQALSLLARMLLQLHTRPALHLVPDEQPRDHLLPIEQRRQRRID